jgi:cytochrome c oxidase subunit II
VKRRTFLAVLLGLSFTRLYAEPRVIPVRAKKFEYSPSEISLELGVPVVLEFTTEDVAMGFEAPELGLQAEIPPGKVTRVPFTPRKAGRFEFHCDVFCGDGHEDMGGVIAVT